MKGLILKLSTSSKNKFLGLNTRVDAIVCSKPTYIALNFLRTNILKLLSCENAFPLSLIGKFKNRPVHCV